MKRTTFLISGLILVAVAAAAVLLARELGGHPGSADVAATQSVGSSLAESPAAVPATQSAVSSAPSAAAASAAPATDVTQSPSGVPETPEPAPEPPAPPVPSAPSHRVIATYFHNTTRCVTCLAIERLAKKTIEAAFASDLASGRLVWRALNMEERENEHYAIDYKLPYPSLVLAEMDGEREIRFKLLGETWNLIHKEPRFIAYIESELRAFLGES